MIKVTLGEVKTQGKPFPKFVTLKKCGGLFLAESAKSITCIDKGTSGWNIGEHEEKPEGWFEFDNSASEAFIDFEGTAIIQNA